MSTRNPNEVSGDLRTTVAAPAPARGRAGPGKIAALAAAIGGLALGAVVLFRALMSGDAAGGERGALMYAVARTPFQVTVTAEGNVESASNIDVKCRVAGGSTILWIVEDGKMVDQGEEIIRLDTSSIDDKLNSQRITYEKAVATHIQAKEDLAVTTIAVKEYEEGTYVEQLKQVEADIQIAMENLRSAENQLRYSTQMVRKGFVSSLQRDADAFAVERAKLDLDAANTRKKVLVDFTREKTLKDLQAKRDAAAARLRSEEASLELEKVRLDRLQEQLKNCTIAAPSRGMVVYANDPGGRFGPSQQAQIGEGAVVREGQALVRLPDLSRMQVKVNVHESRVDQIRPGMPARIVIQDQDYEGNVLSVANQPQASSFFSAKVKEYATTVTIKGETSGLRPGMSAKVTILIGDLPDSLCVPVSAVVEGRGGFYCWVKASEGPERRTVTLGRTNDKLIEVLDGVSEGEEVYRNPRAAVPGAREEPAFEKQVEDTAFGEPSEPAPAQQTRPPAPEAGPPAAPPAGEGPPGGAAKRVGRGSIDLLQFDKDGDKKVSREEAPEQMQGFFERLDGNGDGFIDAAEMAEMRKRFQASGGRPGGPDGTGAPEKTP